MSHVFMIVVTYIVGTVATGSVYAWLGGQFDRRNRDAHPGRAYAVAAVAGATGMAMTHIPDMPWGAPLAVSAVLTTALLMVLLKMSFLRAIGTQLLSGLLGLGLGLVILTVAALGNAGPAILLGTACLTGLMVIIRAEQNRRLRVAFNAVGELGTDAGDEERPHFS